MPTSSAARAADVLAGARGRLPQALAERLPAESSLEAWLEALGTDFADVLLQLSPDELDPVIQELASGGSLAAAVLQRAADAVAARTERKRLRAALHRLRSRGVSVASTPRRAARSVLQPLAREGELAALSAIRPSGARLVLLARPLRGGMRLYQITASDRAGILQIEALDGPRRSARRLFEEVAREGAGAAVAAEPAAVRGWLHSAEEQRSGTTGPPVDPKLVAEVLDGPVGPPPGEAARAALAGEPVPAPAVAATVLRERMRSGALPPWPLDAGPVGEALERLEAVERSRIVLPPQQQQQRRAEALAEEARRLLGPAFRERIARRLEETAWLWLATDDREGALGALATAARIRSDEPPERIELLQRLLELSLDMGRRGEEEARRGKLIVEP